MAIPGSGGGAGPIGVGVVGVGDAWPVHRDALRNLAGRVRVAAVCDAVPLRAEAAAAECGAAAVGGVLALARRPDVRAVLLGDPAWWGLAAAGLVLDAENPSCWPARSTGRRPAGRPRRPGRGDRGRRRPGRRPPVHPRHAAAAGTGGDDAGPGAAPPRRRPAGGRHPAGGELRPAGARRAVRRAGRLVRPPAAGPGAGGRRDRRPRRRGRLRRTAVRTGGARRRIGAAAGGGHRDGRPPRRRPARRTRGLRPVRTRRRDALRRARPAGFGEGRGRTGRRTSPASGPGSRPC